MPGRDEWLDVARASDDDELRERILTGFKTGKPFTPYRPVVDMPHPVAHVLDFGCGAGRNFPYLATIAERVAGFDLPPMIERCRTLAPLRVDLLSDDWNALRQERFDLVFASLVLQHVEPAACAAYLDDFAAMAPYTYLLTRTGSDFGSDILQAVIDSRHFETGSCVQVDHDPQTNQLRVLGRGPIDRLPDPDEGAHYEVLLRSRRFGGS